MRITIDAILGEIKDPQVLVFYRPNRLTGTVNHTDGRSSLHEIFYANRTLIQRGELNLDEIFFQFTQYFYNQMSLSHQKAFFYKRNDFLQLDKLKKKIKEKMSVKRILIQDEQLVDNRKIFFLEIPICSTEEKLRNYYSFMTDKV